MNTKETELAISELKLANRPKNKNLEKVKDIRAFMQYIGYAGEHAVISKLMFQGINAMKSYIDEGYDVVVTNNGKLFFIQVKTAFLNGDENYLYNIGIKKEAVTFHGEYTPIYIFVLTEDGSENDFIIFTKKEIDKHIKLKNIWYMKSTDMYRLKFYPREGKIFLGNMENDATNHFNNWEVFNNKKENKKEPGTIA
ncbi:hypothetical protein ACFL08_00745 [Patescibacteria group bacterium]